MKLNKSKGKVHPSPASSSSSSSSSLSLSSNDPISSLNQLLPAAILTLISVLSLQDREVLAYMINRSVNPSPSPILKKSKKSGSTRQHFYKSSSFDCDCFDCYTAYWFRWDSSPHRELIHQAIEAFEDHLAKTEQSKKSSKCRRREKEKEKAVARCATPIEEIKEKSPEIGSPSEIRETPAKEKEERGKDREREREEEMKGADGKQLQLQQHKGLARKMLPDVIGFLNSRLWNLWGPNV